MKHRLQSISGILVLLCLALLGCSREKAVPRPPAAVTEGDGLTLGNPSGAASQTDQPENFLIVRPQFSLAYNQRNGGPNWVSWHLERSDLGQAQREDGFAPDPLLPEEWRIRPGDYQGSGYDRGHQCPAGDRTRQQSDNQATFVMSNMLPQTGDLNREVWRELEEYCRDLTERGSELYIICGGSGSKGRIARGKVNVPRSCWKVIVALPEGQDDLQRIDPSTRVIAVDVPNTRGIDKHSWHRYVTTVDAIEQETGLDLLSSVPAPVQAVLEAKRDSSSRPERRSRRSGSRRQHKD